MPMNRHPTLVLTFGALALAATLSCHAASDFYLKIDGIDGESTSDQHAGEIEILSFSWGVSNSGSMSSGSGGGAGKASFQDISFVRRLDKASPKLMLACATGQHIPSAILVCRKSGGDGRSEAYYKITLNDILVSSVSTSGNSGGDLPTESFSLNFAKIEWEYVPLSVDGVPEEPVRAGFNVLLNEPIR
jgi:type VI secretion system secreted protein Hcp